MSDFVVTLNEKNEPVGEMEKLAAHQQNIRHLAFSVVVIRETEQGIETLLQQRAHSKYHCGGLWSNTCCSHPKPQESVLAAANRRLIEELNMSLPVLTDIGQFWYHAEFANGLHENEYDHVLLCEISEEPEWTLNSEEVAQVKWVNIDQLQKKLVESSEQFTPWLSGVMALVQTYIAHR